MAFIEALESRLLLSASTAKTAGTLAHAKADEHKISADVNAINSLTSKVNAALKADLTKLGVFGADASLESAVASAGSALVSSLKTDIQFYAPEFNTDALTLFSDEKLAAKEPGNTSLHSILRSDFAAFSAISISGLPLFWYDSDAPAVYSAMEAVVAANPTGKKLAADVSTLKSNLTKKVGKSLTDAQKLFDTDDSNVQSLFPYPN
jgi:hypothetical protein